MVGCDRVSTPSWLLCGDDNKVGEIKLTPDYEPPPTREPTTWLLGQGWTRAKSISMFELPGPRAVARVDA